MSKQSQRDRKARRRKNRDARHALARTDAKRLAVARNTDYENRAFTLSDSVEAPSYDKILDWMLGISGRAASFDIWARGNFTRRLIYNRQNNIQPIIVAANTVDQMRWAFRRLSLVGYPVDFVYTGRLSAPQRILHLHPCDGVHDSGWGFMAALGSVASINDRRWFPIAGTSRLMPEKILDWVVNEASAPFSSGRIFVAPSELIGLPQSVEPNELNGIAEVTNGVPAINDVDASAALFDLEIPFIDGMAPDDFQSFLADHQDELSEFQSAFSAVMRGVNDVDDAKRRLAAEVGGLTRSAKHQQFRTFISKCKGSLS